jgi:membrane protease subunit HflK
MSDYDFDYEKLRQKLSPKVIIIAVAVVLIIIIIATSTYTVGQQEQAVVLRFGKFLSIQGPGLHFKLPLGVDKTYNVPTQRTLKQEFGFRTRKAGIRTQYSSREYAEESIMLTGDLNIVDVEWIIQYKIKDPNHWLFNVEDQDKTIRDISQSVINQLVGDRTIFDVIGIERENIQDKSREMMNSFFDLYGLGIKVDRVKLQNIVPPKGRVQDAFEDVNKAIQDRNRLINEGKEAYNNSIPKARGVAQQTIQEAEGYAVEKVNKARGDISRFIAVYGEYRKNPTITRTRLYYEMFEDLFKKLDQVELIDKKLSNFVPFKSLDKAKKGGNK